MRFLGVVVGSLVGCFAGPFFLAWIYSAVTTDGRIDEADIPVILLIGFVTGGLVGAAVGFRLAGGRWPWWWGLGGDDWLSRWWRRFWS
jgi:hypothetical protein